MRDERPVRLECRRTAGRVRPSVVWPKVVVVPDVGDRHFGEQRCLPGLLQRRVERITKAPHLVAYDVAVEEVASYQHQVWAVGGDRIEHGAVRSQPGTRTDGNSERHRAIGERPE